MQWVWQQKNWPQFEYDQSKLLVYENEFHKNSGILIGNVQHILSSEILQLRIDILTQEALSTSSIEGEILQKDSVQSSIRKHFGLNTNRRKVRPNEAGIAELMVNVYDSCQNPLTHQTLYSWHEMIANGRRDLETIGNYRTHLDPMQIVSGILTQTKIFYEAPPSNIILKEMEAFINWYNKNVKDKETMSTLVFAGITHLYFEMIHPFEDGNGRIGRALVEKAISQRINTPSLNSFATIIEQNKKKYYETLQVCNKQLDINAWLLYFSETVLKSQQYSIKMVQFLVAKAKFFIHYKSLLNARQEKVLLRIFEAGIEGFKGGLSADNYKSITLASPATITRDLNNLVAMKAMIKKGELKHSRYYLNLSGL